MRPHSRVLGHRRKAICPAAVVTAVLQLACESRTTVVLEINIRTADEMFRQRAPDQSQGEWCEAEAAGYFASDEIWADAMYAILAEKLKSK